MSFQVQTNLVSRYVFLPSQQWPSLGSLRYIISMLHCPLQSQIMWLLLRHTQKAALFIDSRSSQRFHIIELPILRCGSRSSIALGS